MSKLSSKVKTISLISATLPVLMTVLITTISAPINTFVVSGVAKTSVESVGTASSIMFLFGVLISLVVGGSGILIGQYIGAKGKEEELKKATHSTFYLMVIFSILITLIVISLSKYLLLAFGLKGGEVISVGTVYILCIAPTQIIGVMQQYFIGTLAIYGYTKYSFFVGGINTILDLSLSLIFVYFFRMGVLGVILGTIIARLIGFIVAFFSYSIVLEPVWKIKYFHWKTAKKIIKISIPIAGEKVNYNATMFVLAIIIGNISAPLGLNKYGHNYMIWARAIYNSSTAIVLVGGLAFSIGLERILARNYGSKNFDEASKNVVKAFFIAFGIDAFIALVIFIMQGYIISFLTLKETNKNAIIMLKKMLFSTYGWLILLELGRVANLIFISATRSAGDTKATAIFSISTSWIFVIFLGWILAKPIGLGWQGIMIAMTIDECIRGLFNFIRWKKGNWIKHIHKISGEIEREKNEKYNTAQSS